MFIALVYNGPFHMFSIYFRTGKCPAGGPECHIPECSNTTITCMDTFIAEVDAVDELACAKSCENLEGNVLRDCNFTEKINVLLFSFC